MSHEYIHALQSKEVASIYRGIGFPSRFNLFGVNLDFSSFGGGIISNLPSEIQKIYYDKSDLYGLKYSWKEIEAYSLAGPDYLK